MTDEMSKILEAMIPLNLDDIIRMNRDAAQLYLTPDEEIMDLYAEIIPGEPKAVMDDWSFITLSLSVPPMDQVMLLANVRGTTVTRLTSSVVKIDLDRQLVNTLSGSLYQLGVQHHGEPDVDQLMAVCAIFNSWGFGEFLGVSRFYF